MKECQNVGSNAKKINSFYYIGEENKLSLLGPHLNMDSQIELVS